MNDLLAMDKAETLKYLAHEVPHFRHRKEVLVFLLVAYHALQIVRAVFEHDILRQSAFFVLRIEDRKHLHAVVAALQLL